jgi:hypothetical protein
MHIVILSLVVLVLALAIVSVTFIVGMRRKVPFVLNAVRRSGRAMKPLILRSAGAAESPTAVVEHVGRTSGRPYETPVVATKIDKLKPREVDAVLAATAGVGVASLRRLELGRADSIEVGSLRIRNVPVAIRSVVRGALPRWQSESFSPLSLGYSLVVDYQRREVLMSRTLPEGPADIRLPMRMNRLPLVRGMLNSKYPAYFVVDTGGELISISAETALSLAMPPVRRIPLKVYGMSGVDENAFLLPGVNLDFEEIEYRNVGLAVLNLRAPSVLLGFQLGGIVGHRFLSDYRVSMDMGRSELRLEKVQTVASR